MKDGWVNECMNEWLRLKLAIIDATHFEIFREGTKPQRDEVIQYLNEIGLYLDHVEWVEYYLEMRADWKTTSCHFQWQAIFSYLILPILGANA